MTLTLDWIGGFFDGEGCVSVRFTPSKKPTMILVSMTQANREILEAVKEAVGVGQVYRQGKHWQYVVGKRDDVRVFVNYLLPYTKLKREELLFAGVWASSTTKTERCRVATRLLEHQSTVRGRPVRTGRIART